MNGQNPIINKMRFPLPDRHSLQYSTGKMVTLTQLQADKMRIADDNFSQQIIGEEF
jgi:hypothetical protein